MTEELVGKGYDELERSDDDDLGEQFGRRDESFVVEMFDTESIFRQDVLGLDRTGQFPFQLPPFRLGLVLHDFGVDRTLLEKFDRI